MLPALTALNSELGSPDILGDEFVLVVVRTDQFVEFLSEHDVAVLVLAVIVLVTVDDFLGESRHGCLYSAREGWLKEEIIRLF